MNRRILTVALFAVLSTMAIGCQKENNGNVESMVSQTESIAVYNIQYKINGERFTATFQSDDEYTAFLMRLMALARTGNKVEFSVQNNASHGIALKETLTYSTPNEADAMGWAKEKAGEGYTVSVTFDENEKMYICIAYRP